MKSRPAARAWTSGDSSVLSARSISSSRWAKRTSSIARKSSSLDPKFAYTAPLVKPASAATSSTDACASPRRAKTRPAASSKQVRRVFLALFAGRGASGVVMRR